MNTQPKIVLLDEPTHEQIWSHVGGIESEDYQLNRERMFNERIVRDMAVGLRETPTAQLINSDGRPSLDFMMAANNEYQSRGGQLAHIGCVAEALIALRKAGIDSLTPEGVADTLARVRNEITGG